MRLYDILINKVSIGEYDEKTAVIKRCRRYKNKLYQQIDTNEIYGSSVIKEIKEYKYKEEDELKEIIKKSNLICDENNEL